MERQFGQAKTRRGSDTKEMKPPWVLRAHAGQIAPDTSTVAHCRARPVSGSGRVAGAPGCPCTGTRDRVDGPALGPPLAASLEGKSAKSAPAHHARRPTTTTKKTARGK